jgi:hypothetical protein
MLTVGVIERSPTSNTWPAKARGCCSARSAVAGGWLSRTSTAKLCSPKRAAMACCPTRRFPGGAQRGDQVVGMESRPMSVAAGA